MIIEESEMASQVFSGKTNGENCTKLSMQELVNLLNEIGMLGRLPRSGFAFLGTGDQSVAAHSHRMALIAYALGFANDKVDLGKLVLMCLFHDLPEARTGDLNYVNKRYAEANEAAVIEEYKRKPGLRAKIAAYLTEYKENKTPEARLAHDADQLELLLMLKEQHDIGNPRAMEWFDNAVKRLKNEESKKLAESIRATPSDSWWKDLL